MQSAEWAIEILQSYEWRYTGRIVVEVTIGRHGLASSLGCLLVEICYSSPIGKASCGCSKFHFVGRRTRVLIRLLAMLQQHTGTSETGMLLDGMQSMTF